MWKKIYSWNGFVWYILEVDVRTWVMRNIVFITRSSHIIHTLDDKLDNIREFVLELDKYIPMLDNYDQSFLEKLSRRLKL